MAGYWKPGGTPFPNATRILVILENCCPPHHEFPHPRRKRRPFSILTQRLILLILDSVDSFLPSFLPERNILEIPSRISAQLSQLKHSMGIMRIFYLINFRETRLVRFVQRAARENREREREKERDLLLMASSLGIKDPKVLR